MIEYLNIISSRGRGRPKKKWLEVRVMIREYEGTWHGCRDNYG